MKRLLLVLAALAVLFLGFNILIDPFYRFNIVSIPTINAQRPMFAYYGRMSKGESICRVQPEQVVIGGSKVEIAMDPHSPAWGGGRVYNMGLAGMPLSEMAQTLAFIARTSPLKRVVIGLDFMHFNQLREDVVYKTEVVDFEPERIASDCLHAFRYDANYLIGPKAAKYALHTMLAQRSLATGQSNALLQGIIALPELLDKGTEPLYWGKVDTQQEKSVNAAYWTIDFDADGYRPNFPVAYEGGANGFGGHSQEEYYVEKIWRPGPKHAYEFGNTFTTLQSILYDLKGRNIEVILFTEPLHARMLLAIQDAGLGPQFEEWKRFTTKIADMHHVPLWDFESFNPVTENPNNYWEPSHYKKEVGDIMLDRILNHATSPVGFGTLLTPDNIEGYLAAQRYEAQAYRQREPDVAKGVDDAVAASMAKTPTQVGLK